MLMKTISGWAHILIFSLSYTEIQIFKAYNSNTNAEGIETKSLTDDFQPLYLSAFGLLFAFYLIVLKF